MFFDGSEIIDLGCLAEGVYNAVVSGAEQSENKAGTGSYVKVSFDMIDESGYSVLNFYNISHENVKVEAMGKRDFKRLVEAATGGVNLERLEDLIGKKVCVTLGHTEFNGERTNNVKKVEAFATSDVPF